MTIPRAAHFPQAIEIPYADDDRPVGLVKAGDPASRGYSTWVVSELSKPEKRNRCRKCRSPARPRTVNCPAR